MNRLGKAFAMFTGASAIGSLTQIAKGKISSVLLGPEGVGVLNQLTSLWSLFSVIAGMGFYNGMLRHMAISWGKDDEEGFRIHATSSLIFLMGTSLTLTGLGCLFSAELSQALFGDEGARADLICLILLGVPVFAIGQVYRAMLNSTRSVQHLVRARIFADISSVAALAVLVYPLGLKGAALAYVALHLLYLGFTVLATKAALGADRAAILKPSRFRAKEIILNFGFGANGLIAAAVGICATLVASRWIIEALGVGANGVFTVALKVATVYLGGLTATAGGYYFPTLSMAKSDEEFHGVINATLSLYLYVIPPVVAVLMTGGELLMVLLFTADFMAAAMLLLLMLPGDLFRISSETLSVSLVVRKHLVASTSLYTLWAAMYLGLAYTLLPVFGLIGVAMAYLSAHVLNSCLVLIVVRWKTGYVPASRTILALLRGLALVCAVAAALAVVKDPWIRHGVSGVFLTLWFGGSLLDRNFARYVRSMLAKARRLLPSAR